MEDIQHFWSFLVSIRLFVPAPSPVTGNSTILMTSEWTVVGPAVPFTG